MTTLSDRVLVDEAIAASRDVKFSRVLVTLITAVFFGIGWTVGSGWRAVVFCAVAVRLGFREAIGAQVQQRPAPSP